MTHTKDELFKMAQAAGLEEEFLVDPLSEQRFRLFAQIAVKALAEQPAQQEPVGCEGAILNGCVYADRLEHDYEFECEAGPLHLCADWVEFRRCFEWLAQHTSPPPQRTWVELTDEEIDAEVTQHEQAHGFIQGVEWAKAKLKEKNA